RRESEDHQMGGRAGRGRRARVRRTGRPGRGRGRDTPGHPRRPEAVGRSRRPDRHQAACADGGQITITATGITYYVSSGMRTAGLAARLGGEIVAQEQVEQEDGEYVADETLVLDAPAEDATLEYRWFAG